MSNVIITVVEYPKSRNYNLTEKKKKKDKRKRILCIRWISEIFHFFISKIITLPNRNAEETKKKKNDNFIAILKFMDFCW